MSTMSKLADTITALNVEVDVNANLPLPNIYFCSVYPFHGVPVHAHIAADFTGAALNKLQQWCASEYNFKPYRSTASIKMRRLLLGDILESPETYDRALAYAKLRGEGDIVAKLEQLPVWIAARLNVPINTRAAAEQLTERLGRELRAVEGE